MRSVLLEIEVEMEKIKVVVRYSEGRLIKGFIKVLLKILSRIRTVFILLQLIIPQAGQSKYL